MEDEFDEKAAVSMTKFLALLLAFLLIFAPAVIRENVKNAVPSEKAAPVEDTAPVEDAAPAEKAPFSYEHDPRENPSAMRDIVVNPDAVYGFSPSGDEQSTLKDYVNAIDWTDPAQVASAREQRAAYHESLQELYDMILSMTKEDKDIETIARAVSQRRNELRFEAYKDDPEGLETVKKRNLETYGNEFGPTQDALFEKYGSWETVLLKALGTNAGMDACLGFYDEYYYLYDLEGETEQ